MNDLQVFNFQGNDVRVKSEDGFEWFVADDIAKSIGYEHTPKMCRMVDDMYKTTVLIRHSGLNYKSSMTVIAEPGIWQILDKSRKTEAKPFQKWLFEEVLPGKGHLTSKSKRKRYIV